MAAFAWKTFFLDAGIPPSHAESYAMVFEDNRISQDMLEELNKEVLIDLGVTLVGHQIAIQRHAKKRNEAPKKSINSPAASAPAPAPAPAPPAPLVSPQAVVKRTSSSGLTPKAAGPPSPAVLVAHAIASGSARVTPKAAAPVAKTSEEKKRKPITPAPVMAPPPGLSAEDDFEDDEGEYEHNGYDDDLEEEEDARAVLRQKVDLKSIRITKAASSISASPTFALVANAMERTNDIFARIGHSDSGDSHSGGVFTRLGPRSKEEKPSRSSVFTRLS
eukprot:m.230449 g.230449  ORF g.230449 m.230449 type:complete len:276 (+) comp18023_c0_seq1:41-868(+)